MSRLNPSLDRWWRAKYKGVNNPTETCPTCKQAVEVMAVNGCFKLHGATPDEPGKPHGRHCPMSGKRAPKMARQS